MAARTVFAIHTLVLVVLSVAELLCDMSDSWEAIEGAELGANVSRSGKAVISWNRRSKQSFSEFMLRFRDMLSPLSFPEFVDEDPEGSVFDMSLYIYFLCRAQGLWRSQGFRWCICLGLAGTCRCSDVRCADTRLDFRRSNGYSSSKVLGHILGAYQSSRVVCFIS